MRQLFSTSFNNFEYVLKIKMFAEGWVVYPRTSGSPEPTWHEARSAECQVGSGDPRQTS